MILYTLPHSSYGTKVAIVIAIKGIENEFEIREPPGGLRTDTYRRVIAMRQIPAIVDGDLTISESEVISEYLDERFPEPALLPADPRARAQSRFFSRFHDIHLEHQSAVFTGRCRSARAMMRWWTKISGVFANSSSVLVRSPSRRRTSPASTSVSQTVPIPQP